MGAASRPTSSCASAWGSLRRDHRRRQLRLRNLGSCELAFTAAAFTENGLPWLSVAPASSTLAPGAATTLSVGFTAGGLAPGTHVGTLEVAGTCRDTGRPAAHNPATVAVSLTVTEGTLHVGGTVSGLEGVGLVLQKSGGRTLAVAADGPYHFPAGPDATYSLAVLRQPGSPQQTCTIAHASGTLGATDVTDADVTCRTVHRLRPRVLGLLGSGLVLSDGKESLAIASPGRAAFAADYASGAPYGVTIVSQPSSPAQTCSVEHGTGTFGDADELGVLVSCRVPAAPLYGSALRWNDYVRNDGPSVLQSSGTACDGTEPGPINACVHAGELVAVTLPGVSDCAGVTAADALGAFQWRCLAGSPWAKVVSTGLQPDKRLADLVDMVTRTWRPNSTTVYENGEAVLWSTSAAWHQNLLSVPAAGNVSLSTAGTVYLVPASVKASYTASAPRVALAVAPGALLTSNGATGALATATGTRFFWAEGTVDAANGHGASLLGTRQSVLRHVRVRRGGVRLVDSSANRLADVFATTANDCLVVDSTSALNLLERVAVFGCDVSGVRLSGSNNTLADVLAGNGRVGIYFHGTPTAGLPPASSNALLAATVALGGSHAFWAQAAPRTTLLGFAAASSAGGLYFSGTGTTGTVRDVGVTHTLINDTPSYNFGLWEGTSPVSWGGLVTLGFVNPACKLGTVSSACESFVDADAVLVTGASLAGSFVGAAGADAVNLSDTGGTALYSATLDSTGFENRWRGWGRQGSFPSAAAEDACAAGQTCAIWEWDLKASDSVARGVLASPAGTDARTVAHDWTVADEAACSAIPGAEWTAPSTCRTTLLARAVELGGDGVGNDNLLCEPGERCLHTPNLGAYQGHGMLVPAGAGGAAGDIELYRYAENGRY